MVQGLALTKDDLTKVFHEHWCAGCAGAITGKLQVCLKTIVSKHSKHKLNLDFFSYRSLRRLENSNGTQTVWTLLEIVVQVVKNP